MEHKDNSILVKQLIDSIKLFCATDKIKYLTIHRGQVSKPREKKGMRECGDEREGEMEREEGGGRKNSKVEFHCTQTEVGSSKVVASDFYYSWLITILYCVPT